MATSYKMTGPQKIFEKRVIWNQTKVSLSFSIWGKRRGEEKKGRGKREKKAEKRICKEFPRCGRGRKRNLGHYQEMSVYVEVVKWAKVLFKKTWNSIPPHPTRYFLKLLLHKIVIKIWIFSFTSFPNLIIK